jgi:hydroxymethylbilane synthase
MKLRIGSRGSRLAVAQAEAIALALREAHSELDIECVRITTTGDRDSHSSLASIGGKGVFVKEIEEALLGNQIDLAVHSLKDVPQQLPPGLILGPCPRREEPWDAFVSRFGEHLAELPRGSTIGTSSPRRAAQIRNRFKKRSFHIEPIRGNVETRLKKVHEGQFDGIVIAAAGLKRIGLESEATQILGEEEMLPAPGQGCLGLEVRESDEKTRALLEAIKHDASDRAARAERAFLLGVGGDCLVPLAALAVVAEKEIRMRAMVLDASGEQAVESREAGPIEQPEYVGALLAERLLHDGGGELLTQFST